MPNVPPPMLNPKTKKPLQLEDIGKHFPEDLLKQEISQDRWIPIPDEVQEIYRLWRPNPLFRARRLEKVLNTPAKIYYKYEGTSPSGSHKLNTAVAQAYFSKKGGISSREFLKGFI